MRFHCPLLASCVCAALLLGVGGPGGAAPAPQRIAVATTTPNVSGVAWIDQGDGPALFDFDQGAALADIFTMTTWEFLDNDQIVVSRSQNGKLEPFLRFDDLAAPDNSYFYFHERTPDGTGINGFVYRDAADATKGFAYFNVRMTSGDGATSSTFVAADLTFTPAASP